jgi:arginine repressor
MSRRWVVGPLVAIVGACLVWIGALSGWAVTSVDPAAMGAAVAVNPGLAREVADFLEATHTWVEGVDAAAWMLTFTTAGAVLAVILLRRGSRAIAGIVCGLGVVLAAVALATRVDPARFAQELAREVEDTVVGTFVFGDVLADVIVVDPGPSTALCVAGALLMAVGGALAFLRPRPDPVDPDYVTWDQPAGGDR